MTPITNVRLSGVGDFLAKHGGTSGTSAPFLVGYLDDTQLGIEGNVAKLFGGDGKFALSTATVEKTITITAKQAVVSMDTFILTQGDVDTDASELLTRLEPRETVTLGATGTNGVDLDVSDLTNGTTLVWGENLVIEYADGSGRFTSTTATDLSGTGTTGVFVEISGSSVIRFGNGDAATRVTISYIYEYDIDASGESEGIVAQVLDNATVGCPFQMWYTRMFDECDNAYGLELMFYSVIPSGKFTLPMTRGGFAMPDVEFEAVDPLRADGRIGILLLRNEV